MPGNNPAYPSIGGSLGQNPRQPIPLTFEETMRLLANPAAFEPSFVGESVHAAASLAPNGGATGLNGLPLSGERQSVPRAPKRLFDAVEQSVPPYLKEITSPSASVVNRRSTANHIKTDSNLNSKSKRARRATSTPTTITLAPRRTQKHRIKKSMPKNSTSSDNLDPFSNSSLDKEQQSEITMGLVPVIRGVLHATTQRLATPGFEEQTSILSTNDSLPPGLNILTGNGSTFGGSSGQFVPESQLAGPMITSQKVGLSGPLTSRESSLIRMERLSSPKNFR